MQSEKNTDINQEALELLVRALQAEEGKRSPASEVQPRRNQPNGLESIDLMQLLLVLRSKLVYIIIAALLCGAAAMFYTTNYTPWCRWCFIFGVYKAMCFFHHFSDIAVPCK